MSAATDVRWDLSDLYGGGDDPAIEDAIHTARRPRGELTTESFGAIRLETQREMFEDSAELTEDYGMWWSYEPHFIHTPGYVHADAFGELMALALCARYLEDPGSGFAEGHVQTLSLDGSKWPRHMVAPLGVDLDEAGFWDKGLSMPADLVRRAADMASDTGAG